MYSSNNLINIVSLNTNVTQGYLLPLEYYVQKMEGI